MTEPSDPADRPDPVVIVGGGPGGMVLAYLLGRTGLPVTLLESHRDFDRDFRGDSLHPYTLELFDRLGLADDLLALPHQRATTFRFHTPAGTVTTADYGRLPGRFPYVALMPQATFLDFLADRVRDLPGCEVRTGATVSDLGTDDTGRVDGVVVRGGRDRDSAETVPARIVIGCDGRFSRLRRVADMPAESAGASTDLLWFRLPRYDTDPPDADVDLFFGERHYVGLLTGTDGWQVGWTLPKGGYPAARDAGVEPIRAGVAELVPWLADRVGELREFDQITLLSVDISRVARWWRPGLLLIGDAAHVISPVGGNGILMAIQDAVATANRIGPVLADGADRPGTDQRLDAAMASVQRDRERSIRSVQAQQVRVEQRVAKNRERGKPILPARFLKVLTAVPGIRRRAAASNAYGPEPPHLTFLGQPR